MDQPRRHVSVGHRRNGRTEQLEEEPVPSSFLLFPRASRGPPWNWTLEQTACGMARPRRYVLPSVNNNNNSMVWVREQTIPTERTPLVGEVSVNFADRGCHVVSVTDIYGRILGFLDRSRCIFFQVSPQLYSRDWVEPIPDPLLLRKSGSVGNRPRTSGSIARNSNQTTEAVNKTNNSKIK
jgi:hypothetical protein